MSECVTVAIDDGETISTSTWGLTTAERVEVDAWLTDRFGSPPSQALLPSRSARQASRDLTIFER